MIPTARMKMDEKTTETARREEGIREASADDDVDRYRRNLRFAQGNGKYLLRCHNVDKFIDLGFQLNHAHVLVGINKAWKREFTILHRPKGITDPQVYVPNFAALEKADKEAEEVRVVVADRTVE